MRLHLRRVAVSPDGTYGRLTSSRLDLVTMEEEDRGNQQGESRIPAGEYTCRRTTYYRHNIDTFEVCDVQGRSRILFHVGNTEEDTEGCILLGFDFGMLDVIDEETGVQRLKLGVIDSQHAFRTFMRELQDINEFQLLIDGPDWKI